MIPKIIQKLLWRLETNLPDRNLRLKPEVVAHLKRVQEIPLAEIPTISHEEVLRELGIDAIIRID